MIDSKSEYGTQSSVEQQESINKLNAAFSAGESIIYHIDELRKLEKPILVDFNNVLANNTHPLIGNPESNDFIEELSKAGTIVIATTTRDWNYVYSFLQENGLWRDNMVLMTLGAFSSVTDSYGYGYELADQITDEFFETLEKTNRSGKYNAKKLRSAPAYKRLGLLFNKEYDIPLIDDLGSATRDNPGILGIHVKSFMPPDRYVARTDISLTGAADIVKKHYSNI